MPALVDPEDLKAGVPNDDTRYGELVKVVKTFDPSMPETTMVYQLKTMEDFIVQLKTKPDWQQKINRLKGYAPTLVNFIDPETGAIISPDAFTHFKADMKLGDDLSNQFVRVVQVVGPRHWIPRMDSVVEMIELKLPPSAVPVTHWPLARSGLSLHELGELETLAPTVDDYESMYSVQWLTHVRRRIPTATQLRTLNTPLPSDDEFAPLVRVVQRHPGAGAGADVLMQKLVDMHDFWQESLKGKGVVLTPEEFLRLKLALNHQPGTGHQTVMNRHRLWGTDVHGLKLAKILGQVDTFEEFMTLQVDAENLDVMIDSTGITVEMVQIAAHGFTPKVMRIARAAQATNPQWYDARCVELDSETFDHKSVQVMLTPTWLKILNSPESSDLLPSISNGAGEVFEVVHSVVKQFPLSPTCSAEHIHKNLVVAYQLIENNPSDGTSDGTSTFVDQFKRAYPELSANIDNPALDDILTNNYFNIATDKHLLIRLIRNSNITPETIDHYIRFAREQRTVLKMVVPLPTLEAAYEGHTPESFSQLYKWSTEYPLMAKRAGQTAIDPHSQPVHSAEHAVRSFHQRQSDMELLRKMKAELAQHHARLKELPHQEVARHEDLEDIFPGLKAPYYGLKFTKTHPHHNDDGSTPKMLERVHDSRTLTELDHASGKLLAHPQVAAAKAVLPALDELKSKLQRVPSQQKLEQLENSKQILVDARDAAQEWLTSFQGQEGSGGGGERATQIESMMLALTKGVTLARSVLQDEYYKVFGASYPRRVVSAHSHFTKLLEAHETSTENIRKNIAELRTAATKLLNDNQDLMKVWLNGKGTTDEGVSKVLPKLETISNTETNLDTVKRELDALAKLSVVTTSRKANGHVVVILGKFEETHATYDASELVEAHLPELQEKLDTAHKVVRHHSLTVPILASKTPTDTAGSDSDDSTGDQPKAKLTALELRKQASDLLSADTLEEREALAETVVVTHQLDTLKRGKLSEEMKKGDFNIVAIRTKDSVVEKADAFCAECKKHPVVTEHIGTDQFDGLHTDGHPNDEKFAETEAALQRQREKITVQVDSQAEILADMDGMLTVTLPRAKKNPGRYWKNDTRY